MNLQARAISPVAPIVTCYVAKIKQETKSKQIAALSSINIIASLTVASELGSVDT